MIKIAGLLAVCVLALAACGSSNKSSSTKTSAAGSGGGGYGGAYGGGSTSTTKTTGASTSSGSGTVQAMDNFFQPKTITGKAGSTVTITLKNAGAAEHTFTVDSQKINKTLAPGSTTTVSVKIPASGSVQFYCMFHRALGMTGTIKAS